MNKRLSIQIDNIKVVKDAEGKDAPVVFGLTLPYGVPYALAYEAIEEMIKELKAMDEASKPKEPEVVHEPELVN